jgi:hypothetical protein
MPIIPDVEANGAVGLDDAAVSVCLLPGEATAASGNGAAADFPASLSPWFKWVAASLGTYPENLTCVIMRFHHDYDANTYCWD